MYSGDPNPLGELRLLLEKKRQMPNNTVEIVSEMARWIKGQLEGASIEYQYHACAEKDPYAFGLFFVQRQARDMPCVLEMKISEVGDRPFVFADVFSGRRGEEIGFPFTTPIDTDEGREMLLNYISDFVLSTE